MSHDTTSPSWVEVAELRHRLRTQEERLDALQVVARAALREVSTYLLSRGPIDLLTLPQSMVRVLRDLESLAQPPGSSRPPAEPRQILTGQADHVPPKT
jgi:hypothetical protein